MPTQASESHTHQVLADYIEHQNKYGRFGGNILIAYQDNIVFEQSTGYADIKLKRPITQQTLFKAGAITKQLTAAAILRLHEQNKLDIHQPIKAFYPTLKHGDTITVAMLLNHTAGFYRDPSWREYESRCESSKLIENTIDRASTYPPSKLFNESNANYHLLGGIIEQVTGQPYNSFINDELLRPLGMSGSSLKLTLSFQLAKSYELSGLVDAHITPSGCAWAAGELITTVRDLYIWSRALQTGKIISHELYQTMLKEQYGVFHEEIGGQSYYIHRGNIDGFKGFIIQQPTSGLSIIALSNLNNTNIDFLAVDLISILNHKAPIHKVIPPKTNFADWQYDVDVIGNYLDTSGVPLQVVYQNGALVAKVNQFDIPLKIKNNHTLFAIGVDNKIRISRNANETTREIIFFSKDGRYLSRFSRIK
ncbi:serine hydrolase domain-containing protein [Photobacterium sanctipauli]|uniref:serine hydrolase domain-containing protein n=1 Tax=Photobacterium sanctipauli TaxID=1342794 RepID=UPI0005655862|nr:serine hydrolase domain-containing protein [Photobacterium sanctipauli]